MFETMLGSCLYCNNGFHTYMGEAVSCVCWLGAGVMAGCQLSRHMWRKVSAVGYYNVFILKWTVESERDMFKFYNYFR